MDENNKLIDSDDIQPESPETKTEGDKPALSALERLAQKQAEEPEKPSETKTGQSVPWTQRAAAWAIAGLVGIVAGFLLGFFLLYTPANQKLTTAQNELASTKTELAGTSADLEEVRSELNGSQSALEQSMAELKVVQLELAVAQVQSNVFYARLALVTRDLLTARQELSAADENLKSLATLLGDQETAGALQERLDAVRDQLATNSTRALDELRILSENLGRLNQ